MDAFSGCISSQVSVELFRAFQTPCAADIGAKELVSLLESQMAWQLALRYSVPKNCNNTFRAHWAEQKTAQTQRNHIKWPSCMLVPLVAYYWHQQWVGYPSLSVPSY